MCVNYLSSLGGQNLNLKPNRSNDMKPKKPLTTPFYISSVFSFGPISAVIAYFILNKKQLSSKDAFWKVLTTNMLVSMPFIVLLGGLSAVAAPHNTPVDVILTVGVLAVLMISLFCAVFYCALSGVFALIAIAIRNNREE